MVAGDTQDIRKYFDFIFYDWVAYRDNMGLGETLLGIWSGVSHKIGKWISYWIKTVSGNGISCTNVQRITNI